MLESGFIFEVGYGGWEPPVLNHVGVAAHLERQLERDHFVEDLAVKDAGANQLARHLGHDEILTGFQNVDAGDFGFLMLLFGFELRRFGGDLALSLFMGSLEQELLQQFRMIKSLGIAFKKGHDHQRALLRMEIPGLLESQ